MNESPHYICVVCGRQIPTLPKVELIEIGCALKRNDEQYVFFCLGRHTKEEVAAAITGVPRFKKASDLKKG